MLDISNLDKAEVLVALYNNSRPLGLGFLQEKSEPMTVEEANQLLQDYKYFDYVHGRVMKVNLSGDTLDPWLYDRDNGQGAAERALSTLL